MAKASAVPVPQVGKWTRKVTSADVNHTGATGIPAGSICTLSINNGVLNASVACTKVGSFDIALVAGGVAAVTKSDGVPPQLVGCWHRHVGALPVGTPAGVWLIQITRAGKLHAFTPGMTSCTGVGDFSASVSVTADRLTIGHVPVCANKGVYSWKASGTVLTLGAVSDAACPARLGLFAGVWKRK